MKPTIATLVLALFVVACQGEIEKEDAGQDPEPDANSGSDSGFDGGSDPGFDGGSDPGFDGGSDPGLDAGSDPGLDGGSDPGFDAGSDPGPDGGSDPGADQNGQQRLIQLAAEIGSRYDCRRPSNVDYVAGNIGYGFIGDEQTYATAKLMSEKGCLQGVEKYVIAYVASVNFPSNGVAAGAGQAAEQEWLDYWDYLVNRFAALGFKIIVHPMPFILSDGGIQNFTAPGLRWLTRADLNMNAGDIPVVFECKDGRQTVIASLYDPRTLPMGETFYQGIADFFSDYAAFTKISIVPPSDFGEYGFPFGVTAGWWAGSDNVGDCFLTGDQYAQQVAPTDPPSYAQYDGKLNEFRASIAQFVMDLFPTKRYMIYMGYGSDGAERHGFEYEEVVNYCVPLAIDLHSSHATGIDAAQVPLNDIVLNKPDYYSEFTFENAGLINEYASIKNLYLAWNYQVSGLEAYASFLYHAFFTTHLFHTTGRIPGASGYSNKELYFEDVSGLGSLKSQHLQQGYMDTPANGASLNGDITTGIGGWAFYAAPYGDQLNYNVYIYAGQLIENSPFPPDAFNSNPVYNTGSAEEYHPQFMRLVAQTITDSERAVGLGDSSRFGASWRPNLSNGKAVMRIFIENTESQIIAEHPASPLILNIASKVTGSYTIARLDYMSDRCSRDFRIYGNAVNADSPATPIDIVVLDEYRGLVVAQGTTDSSGDFDIRPSIASPAGEETRHITFRAYAYVDTNNDGDKDLVALSMDMTEMLSPGAGGYNTISNKFLTVLNCEIE
jgi:hypothetical protein